MNERTDKAQDLVSTYWKWSAAAGLIPVPFVDIAAVTAVQLKMISDLAKMYDVSFRKDLAKSAIGSLIGAVTAPALATGTLGLMAPLLKAMPGVGTVIGVMATPAFNAASTYALGRVFIQHFEAGGTFLDMDPAKVREHFRQEFQGAPSPGRVIAGGR